MHGQGAGHAFDPEGKRQVAPFSKVTTVSPLGATVGRQCVGRNGNTHACLEHHAWHRLPLGRLEPVKPPSQTRTTEMAGWGGQAKSGLCSLVATANILEQYDKMVPVDEA